MKLLSIIALILSTQLNATVFESDSRQVLKEFRSPYSQVVVIRDKTNRFATYCTGILVSEDIVLTSYRCLRREDIKKYVVNTHYRFRERKYYQYERPHEYKYEVGITDIFQNSYMIDTSRPEVGTYSLAFLRLDKPIGKIVGYAKFDERVLDHTIELENREVDVVAYSRYWHEKNDGYASLERCNVRDNFLDYYEIVLGDCSLSAGAFGSPMFLSDSNKFAGMFYDIKRYFNSNDEPRVVPYTTESANAAISAKIISYYLNKAKSLLKKPSGNVVTFCNKLKSKEDIYIAMGSKSDGKWKVQGWRSLVPGACDIVRINPGDSEVYYYADSVSNSGNDKKLMVWNGKGTQGKKRFCVNSSREFSREGFKARFCLNPFSHDKKSFRKIDLLKDDFNYINLSEENAELVKK